LKPGMHFRHVRLGKVMYLGTETIPGLGLCAKLLTLETHNTLRIFVTADQISRVLVKA
jgi:hypothetical protein